MTVRMYAATSRASSRSTNCGSIQNQLCGNVCCQNVAACSIPLLGRQPGTWTSPCIAWCMVKEARQSSARFDNQTHCIDIKLYYRNRAVIALKHFYWQVFQACPPTFRRIVIHVCDGPCKLQWELWLMY
jgi:hypothetical protein